MKTRHFSFLENERTIRYTGEVFSFVESRLKTLSASQQTLTADSTEHTAHSTEHTAHSTADNTQRAAERKG